MARVAEHVVGRAEELGALDDAIAALDGGEPGALLLVGAPGIGKTRLLAELAARADERGCIVLGGSASELERDLPFWVFVDALDEYVAGLDPRRLASLEPDVGAELARVLPSLSGFARPAEPALQDERYRAHRAVRDLLERLAATKPIVLVLDDVHWADSASVELLGALLRRPPAAAVLLALGARPRQLPDRLARALERAARSGALTRLELAELERDDALRLLGDEVDRELAESLFAESGGNPFYLQQLARTPRTGRSADPASLAGVDVPPAVAAALAEELELLSAPARSLLEGAAVAGDPFEPELASAAAAMAEEAATQALDELLATELVRPTGVPRRFRFRHPLVRRAVYDSAPGGWALGAHERCALVLSERGASAAARAHHVEQAARHGDAAALAVLSQAGLASASRAPASAARWYGAALRLLPDSAPPGERVELLLARARALGACGLMEESRAALLESLALVPEELVEMRVRLTVACAGMEHMLGRLEDAHARITATLERLPDPEGREAVALMTVLAFDALFHGDAEGMRQAAIRAREAARPFEDRALSAAPAAVVALSSAFVGAIPEAAAAADEAAALVDSMSDDELAAHLDAAAHLAMAELYLDRYEHAGRHGERALEIGRATGQVFPSLIPNLATVHVMRGRLAEAVEVIDGAVEAARLVSNPQDIAWTQHVRSLAALCSGDVGTARDAAEEAFELTRPLVPSFVTAYPGVAFATAVMESGDAARAREILLGRAGGEELPLVPGAWRAAGLELLTLCQLEAGDQEGAARAAERAEALAAALPLPTARCWARRATAAVALAEGRDREAAERALEAAAAADQVGAVIEAAQSRRLAGRALAQAGEEERAAQELERAAADLEACGAMRYRDAAERELRKLGHHVQRPSRRGSADAAGLESLSERELEVARLLVDRRTNREIAGQLFVSLKTVESHVRNLFRKLDVSSRAEVARTVERLERVRAGGPAPDRRS